VLLPYLLSTLYQALFFNDVELKDSKATLRHYKVPAKATIFIERRQLSMADYDILDGHDQIEEGFKGTREDTFFRRLLSCAHSRQSRYR
jgi:hypothetical protein